MSTRQELPNVCFSCKKGMTGPRYIFEKLQNEDGYSLGDALGETGVTRMCCARHIITDVSVKHEVESELDLDANVRIPVQTESEVTRVKKTAKIPNIPHLGGYVPDKILPFKPDTMFITNETPFREIGKDDLPNPIEWKTRSRVMALVWLLTKTIDEKGTVKPNGRRVLWLGSGDINITTVKYILDTFPEHFFTLIDWKDVDKNLLTLQKERQYRERLVVQQQLFSDYMATELVNSVDVFFSEYVRADTTKAQYEIQVNTDMRAQLDWYQRIKPQYSLLRLQIPRGGEFRYAQGVAFVPPWTSPQNNIEYLFLEDISTLKYINYDYKSEQQRLSYHNRVRRLTAWSHQTVKESVGLDHCWDCATESHLLWTFIRSVSRNMMSTLVINKVHKMSEMLSRSIDPTGKWTLKTPPNTSEVDMESNQVSKATIGKV